MGNFTDKTLKGRTALITGAGGLLGPHHGIGLSSAGAKVILADIDSRGLENSKNKILEFNNKAQIETIILDITDLNAVIEFQQIYTSSNKYIDILVNNAALNPTMKEVGNNVTGKIEDYDMDQWNDEINVGITGAFICSRVFGSRMAAEGSGVIINISSDLAIRAPDQRVYSPTMSFDDIESYKPLGYSIVKTALIGMTRYLAEYWGHKNVRVNALLPGGVYNNQPQQLVENVKKRTLLGRWAKVDEYEDAIVFLASESSAYMTGQSIVMDGGRSV
jgi:NAD(P)-dependent dehydrogenase (short-subunit alcohol dehydrogenase family)